MPRWRNVTAATSELAGFDKKEFDAHNLTFFLFSIFVLVNQLLPDFWPGWMQRCDSEPRAIFIFNPERETEKVTR